MLLILHISSLGKSASTRVRQFTVSRTHRLTELDTFPTSQQVVQYLRSSIPGSIDGSVKVLRTNSVQCYLFKFLSKRGPQRLCKTRYRTATEDIRVTFMVVMINLPGSYISCRCLKLDELDHVGMRVIQEIQNEKT